MYSGEWCAEKDGLGVFGAAADVVCGGGDGGDIYGAGLLCISGSGAGISSVWTSSPA